MSPGEGSWTFGASPGNRENKPTASPRIKKVKRKYSYKTEKMLGNSCVLYVKDLVSRYLGLLVTDEGDVKEIFLVLEHLEG